MSARYIGNNAYNGLSNQNRYLTNATNYEESVVLEKNYIDLPFDPAASGKDSLLVTVTSPGQDTVIIPNLDYTLENNNTRVTLNSGTFGVDDYVYIKYFSSVPVESQKTIDLADVSNTIAKANQILTWDSIQQKYVPNTWKNLSNTSVNGPIKFDGIIGQTEFDLGYVPSDEEAIIFFIGGVPIPDTDYYITGDKLVLNTGLVANAECIYLGFHNNDVTQNTIDTFLAALKFNINQPNEHDILAYEGNEWINVSPYYQERPFEVERILYSGTSSLSNDGTILSLDRIILEDEYILPFVSHVPQRKNIDFYQHTDTSVVQFFEKIPTTAEIEVFKFINNVADNIKIFTFEINNYNNDSNVSTQRRDTFKLPFTVVDDQHIIPFISGVYQPDYSIINDTIVFPFEVVEEANVTLLIFNFRTLVAKRNDLVAGTNMVLADFVGHNRTFDICFVHGKQMYTTEYTFVDNLLTPLEFYSNGTEFTVYSIYEAN